MFLLIGSDSEIGAATYLHLKAQGNAVAATTRRPQFVATDRPLLDLTDLSSWEPPPGTSAACICAAIPRLAACAADPVGSAYINVHQTLALVERLTARGIYVLFLSSNQVFDGSVAHVPADMPLSPVSEYGRQKAEVEAALQSEWSTNVGILRLAKVVSPAMPLLHKWAQSLLAGKTIDAFRDVTIAPTPVELVSAAITALMEAKAAGIFQLTAALDIPYADIAHWLARRLEVSPSLINVLEAGEAGMPIGSAPRHTTLDSSALWKMFGIAAPASWHVLDRVMQKEPAWAACSTS